MRERDERKRLEEVEQRRVQMLLTQENALEARIQNERDNHRFASEMRKEASAIRELYKLEKEQVLLEKQGMVADVKESEKLVAPALDERSMLIERGVESVIWPLSSNCIVPVEMRGSPSLSSSDEMS